MSMRVRDLHSRLGLSGNIQLVLSQGRGITRKKHSFTRSPYVESLLKHPFLPKHFGEAFDEIMSPEYSLEDARVNIRYTEFGRTNPEAAILSERAMIQHDSLVTLMEEAEKWIEAQDRSYKHQGNLESFRKSFAEYFEQGEKFEHSWDRLVTALKTVFEEELIVYDSEQLRRRCSTISQMLDPEKPPQEDPGFRDKLKKELDDLVWYFDNFCVGATPIDEISELVVTDQTPAIQPKKSAQEVEGEKAFDGKLIVVSDGAIYIKGKQIEAEPSVGRTLYALLSKPAGYVTYWDIARAIYGKDVKDPQEARRVAIRKYMSTLKKLLKCYFSDFEIVNQRGQGWVFQES